MDLNLLAKISTPIVTLFLGIIINRLIESREKLIAHIGYIASHNTVAKEEGQEPSIVNTHSVIIKNVGRKAAKNVRLGHNYLPDVTVYPDIKYLINALPGGGKEIVFPTLTPKKEVMISYLYFPPNVWSEINTHIESDKGPAKVVQVLLQPQSRSWVLIVTRLLIIIGIISIVYVSIEILTLLAI